MIKLIILVISLLCSLEARENPFFFESNLKQLPYTSNTDENLPPLHRAAVTLPSKARTIEKVTVTYKTLNGSVEEKSIVLGNSIDWHIPIFISQNYTVSETTKHIHTKKSNTPKKAHITVKKQNTSKLNTVTKQTKFTEIAKRQYIKFLSFNKKLKIVTKSTKIRDFLLVKPHRIVIDFQKSSDVLSFKKNNPNNIFKKIVIGNHDKYYRVVIELDGYYRYKINKIDDGYLISLQ